MTTIDEAPAATAWRRITAEACGGEVALLGGGEGPPLVVLPRENGHPPQHEFLDRLAAHHTVYHPWYPGFHEGGDPANWEWLSNVRDLAVVQIQLVAALGISRLRLVGQGFGGWVAAEMASMNPSLVEALVLVAPMGIQPIRDYIYDQFLVSTEAYARRGFVVETAFARIYGDEPSFEQLEGWETDREMTSRLAWKPYMYNRSLPPLLSGVTARTLVLWGDEDAVVPVECGELYRLAIKGAQLEVIAGAGHAVDLEQPEILAAKTLAFFQGID